VAGSLVQHDAALEASPGPYGGSRGSRIGHPSGKIKRSCCNFNLGGGERLSFKFVGGRPS